MFLLHNHWLVVHKVGWNACVTDGLKGEGGSQKPFFLIAACRHKCPFAGIEMGIKGERGQKCVGER